jgi:hypothetical protein
MGVVPSPVRLGTGHVGLYLDGIEEEERRRRRRRRGGGIIAT